MKTCTVSCKHCNFHQFLIKSSFRSPKVKHIYSNRSKLQFGTNWEQSTTILNLIGACMRLQAPLERVRKEMRQNSHLTHLHMLPRGVAHTMCPDLCKRADARASWLVHACTSSAYYLVTSSNEMMTSSSIWLGRTHPGMVKPKLNQVKFTRLAATSRPGWW